MPDSPKFDPPRPPPSPARPGTVPPVIAAPAEPLPRIDGYRVETLLGSGAMGDVYRAVQLSLGRPVAVKVLAANANRPGMRERFDREAKVLAKLGDHPNVVTVFDHGVTPAGHAYIVMALVDGESLEEWLTSRWRPAGGDAPPADADPDEPLRLLAKVCLAVGSAHAAGVVHRDLKPANVMVDRRGEPQVLDFGIARLLASADGFDATATLSQAGSALGTPAYASPEQAMFDPALVTARSDVYSLGVILYKVLTGGLYPYPITDADKDPWRVFDVVRRADVIHPRQRGAAARRAGTPPPALPLPEMTDPLVAVLLKALAKRPEDRYATADELGRDLLRCLGLRAGSSPMLPVSAAGRSAPPPPTSPPRLTLLPTPVPGVGRVKSFVNSVRMTLVRVEPGTFVMGSPKREEGRCDDEVPHKVRLTRAFYLAATPVAQAQWAAVMGSADNPSAARGDDLPVEQVTWEEAAAFCRQLADREGRPYRLPTEAEWEYAARAGTTTPFHTGRTIDTGQANFDGSSTYANGPEGVFRGRPVPVGGFPANAWGLHDVHGNVWEWCGTWYGPYPAGWRAAVDPRGPDRGQQRVIRGGSWGYGPRNCRSAFRGRSLPGHRSPHVGFRVAMDAG